VTSSASPGAERTPPASSGGSSAAGSRLRRWRRGSEGPELAELDEEQAAELVRRSAELFRDQQPVSGGPAELDVEDEVRREVERATRELTEATAKAQAAAEAATRAREAAERAAREQAVQARTEALRREVAEQLASESVEQVAAAAAARAAAEETALRVTLEREAAEPRIRPQGVPDLVELRSPSSSAALTVLLGLGALVAAGVAVYEAYLDRLTTPSGLVASATTLLLVVIVGRAHGAAARVWLEQGVLHVDEGDGHRRFDLTSPTTKVEMVGRPGTRRWKVLFLRKGMAPYEIDASIVDPVPFVEAIRPYRPHLDGRG